MTTFRTGLALALVLFLADGGAAAPRARKAAPPPTRKPEPTVLWDAGALAEARRLAAAGDPGIAPALERLKMEAEEALGQAPVSVMDKEPLPPSNDKHDYVSAATYHWPNPNTPDGLPLVRKDGERSPEVAKYDAPALGKMTKAVIALALGYHFFDHKPYAEHGARLLRTWFIDDETRMNPHLEYAQFIRGVNTGRGAGIVDFRKVVHLPDSATLLLRSGTWTDQDHDRLKDWFRRYAAWLVTSKNGQSEARKKNNHGTWYEVQGATYARFAGDSALAQHFVGRLVNRIAFQIPADGKQAHELARTRAFHYSTMNLEGLCHAAYLGEQMGFDLWGFRAEHNGDIRTALDFLLPFALGDRPWPYKQVTDWQPDLEMYALLLHRASRHYSGANYDAAVERLRKSGRLKQVGIQYFLLR